MQPKAWQINAYSLLLHVFINIQGILAKIGIEYEFIEYLKLILLKMLDIFCILA
jgi:hypothetical protein